MATDIPDSHPRKRSLISRYALTDAAAAGMLAESALIAHGRGEAFDYLLGERTHPTAAAAIAQSAALLAAAERPCLTLNGNTTALVADEALQVAAVCGAVIELNVYYRTEARIEALMQHLRARRDALLATDPPPAWRGTADEWHGRLAAVPLLGEHPDATVPGLEGPRAVCNADGMLAADVLFVPLEDGDRCEAMVAHGAQVIVVDLNPLSRTARTASVTIVDEVGRAMPQLLAHLLAESPPAVQPWDNRAALEAVLRSMGESIAEQGQQLLTETDIWVPKGE